MTGRTFILDTPERKDRCVSVIGRLPLDNKVWDVTVEPHMARRTNSQNTRLWLLHTAAGEHTGYSPEEMHEYSLCRFFGFAEREVKDLFTGEIKTKRVPLKRSSTRNKKEFAQFMEETEIWYIEEFGVFLGDQ